MNSYPMNYAIQNQKALHPNYKPGPITNPFQAPINNFNQIIPKYVSPQPLNMSPIPLGHSPASIRPPNIIQPQHLNQNTPNIIYNQSLMNNTNLTYKNENKIPKQNNIIPYYSEINSKINKIQGKSNQVQYLNILNNDNVKKSEKNQNINKISSENNPQNKIINDSDNKSIIIQKERKDEAMNDHPPIPLKFADKVKLSICKISYHYNNKTILGTGFFMKYFESLKLLITNYHVIFPALMNINIEIEIWNNKKLILNLKGRYIKFLEKPKDITAIEIKTTDDIYKDIQFLNYDLNYIHNGYNIYNNAYIFTIEHPLGEDASAASGKIIEIYKSQFDHNISTDNGSSGSPIILLNLMMVIGIHKNTDSNKVNGGTFIGELINEINYDLKSRNQSNIIINNENYIIGEIYIKDEDVNEEIRIINSYEEARRNNDWIKFEKELKNEEQIKECEIEMNNKLVPFNYLYKFKNKGKCKIKYKFKKNLTNTNFMFYGCDSIINLNLSNFNTQNITNMGFMFCGCKSLININLSNFNTQNITNMGFMFYSCKSLINLNLSNFNIQNVTNMERMFSYCKSLTDLNLSNFNTQNVTNINSMFCGCKSLTDVNLSNFNTQNVTNMEWMFFNCESLINLNLSNFNTQNVTNMFGMFCGCKSLTYLDLSNFITQNVTNMKDMFSDCELLKKGKVITIDYKIIEKLKEYHII